MTIYVAVCWLAFMINVFYFHIAIVTGIIAIVAAWGKRWILSFASIPLLLITLWPTVQEYRPKPTPVTHSSTIKVMSVNLLMVNKDTTSIIEEILLESPDVLLVQEYTDHWHQAFASQIAPTLPL